MDASTRRLVRRRSGNRCEYCRLPQAAVDATFRVEHITPRQHGGGDGADNLALACDRCNLAKGPNLTSIDPDTGRIASLFSPRADSWKDHFELQGSAVVGRTPTGRATARLLQFNDPHRRRLRELLIELGEF
ncbi:MAG: HNH endonuclease signature motif containing protein [Planctomycetales bacterium]